MTWSAEEWEADEPTIVEQRFESITYRDDGSHPMHDPVSRSEYKETAELSAVEGCD